jgi:HEAT repeat protein
MPEAGPSLVHHLRLTLRVKILADLAHDTDDFASDKAQNDKRRATALAALEGNLDKNDPNQVEKVLELAGAEDTPDAVRDVALRRVGEMPRKDVVERLYKLFNNENWKIRWVAAELVLKMSDQSQLDEFMSKLGRTKGLAITEPLRYGALIADLKGKTPPVELASKYAKSSYPTAVRLSALGYFYDSGDKSQVSMVERYRSDNTSVPECLPDAQECEWKCAVSGGKELKEIETVGSFVEFCVTPAMQQRDKPQKKGEEKANE